MLIFQTECTKSYFKMLKPLKIPRAEGKTQNQGIANKQKQNLSPSGSKSQLVNILELEERIPEKQVEGEPNFTTKREINK